MLRARHSGAMSGLMPDARSGDAPSFRTLGRKDGARRGRLVLGNLETGHVVLGRLLVVLSAGSPGAGAARLLDRRARRGGGIARYGASRGYDVLARRAGQRGATRVARCEGG